MANYRGPVVSPSYQAVEVVAAAIGYALKLKRSTVAADFLLPTQMVPIGEAVVVEITDFSAHTASTTWLVVLEEQEGFTVRSATPEEQEAAASKQEQREARKSVDATIADAKLTSQREARIVTIVPISRQQRGALVGALVGDADAFAAAWRGLASDQSACL